MLSAALDPQNAVSFSFILIITTYQSHYHFWDFGWTRVSFERFAVTNVIPLPPFSNSNSFFRKYRRSIQILDCVAWVSSMRDCSDSVEQGTPFFFGIDLSWRNSLLVGWCLGSTKRFFPRRMTTQQFRSGVVVVGNSMSAKKLYNMNLKNWSNYSSSWNCGINSRICIGTRKCVYILCMLECDLQNHHLRLQRFFSHFSTETRFQNDASSQTFVNWISVSNISKFWRCSRKLFPDTGSSLLGVCTGDFASCVTSFSICSFSFVVNLSEVISLIWLQTKLFTPVGNGSADTDLICWVNRSKQRSSVFEASALLCMVSLLFFLFRIPRLEALMLWNTGWLVSFESFHNLCGCGIPFSFWCITESSVPFLFVSRTEQCPVSSRESLRTILDLFGIFKPTVLHFLSLSTRYLWTLTWIWFGLRNPGSAFRCCRSFWIFWRISNDVGPGKIFHSNSIGSPPIPIQSL